MNFVHFAAKHSFFQNLFVVVCFFSGGGLQVNYDSDTPTPTFAEYAAALNLRCPNLFDGSRILITGDWLIIKL